MLSISIKAKIFISTALQTNNKQYCFIQVMSGGCQGLQYNIELLNDVPKDTTIVQDIFLIDNYSLELLSNSRLDLEEDLGYKKLTIKSPNNFSSCSCGKSFSI